MGAAVGIVTGPNSGLPVCQVSTPAAAVEDRCPNPSVTAVGPASAWRQATNVRRKPDLPRPVGQVGKPVLRDVAGAAPSRTRAPESRCRMSPRCLSLTLILALSAVGPAVAEDAKAPLPRLKVSD